MDRPVPGNDPVSQDPLVCKRFVHGSVRDEPIHLDEGILVQ